MSLPITCGRVATHVVLVVCLSLCAAQLAFTSPVSCVSALYTTDIDTDDAPTGDDLSATRLPELVQESWASGTLVFVPMPARTVVRLVVGPRLTRGPPKLSA